MPGKKNPADGLTKWYGNGMLEKILILRQWNLADTPKAALARKIMTNRKKISKHNTNGGYMLKCVHFIIPLYL